MTVSTVSGVVAPSRQISAHEHLQNVVRHTVVSTHGSGSRAGLKMFIGGVKLHDDTAWIAEDEYLGQYLENAVGDSRLLLTVINAIMLDRRTLAACFPDKVA